MKRPARIPGLPLLVKELVEQGARRRTYVVRVAYAVLLFVAFAIFFYGEVAGRGMSYQMLGVGGKMFNFLLGVQLVGVYIFLPAMMAGVITYEKERRSLELLFITDLGPWEIVLQKLAGRLLPMFTFLLLSLPLMAVCYTYGGVESGYVALAAYLLFTTCVQVGAFALMVSAYSRTSSEATVATYGGGVGLFFAMMAVLAFLEWQFGLFRDFPVIPVSSLAPFVLLMVQSMGMPMGGSAPPMVLLLPLPWIWTALFLLGARRFLMTRAFLHRKKRWDLFRIMDGWLMKRRRRAVRSAAVGRSDSAERLGPPAPVAAGSESGASDPPPASAAHRKGRRGRWRHRHGGEIPGDHPITWREVTRTALGTPRYFACTSLVFALPLLAASFFFVRLMRGEETLGFTLVIAGLWIAAALSVAMRSASAFAAERTNKTLDILLTTPLTGREIVEQKAAVVRRRTLLFVVLLGVLFLAEAWMEARSSYRFSYSRHVRGADLGVVGYLVTAFLSVGIYLSAVSWVARWIGLKVRRRARATTITLGVLFAWCVGPFVLAGMIVALTRTYGRSNVEWLFALSPVTIVACTEIANFTGTFRDLFNTPPAVPIVPNFGVHVVIALVFRSLCLDGADRYLGRAVPGADGDSHHGDTETRRTA